MDKDFAALSDGDQAFRGQGTPGIAMEPMYAGATSFMRRRYTKSLDGVDLAVVGIPFDLATSNRPGARFGPRAVRTASAQLAWNQPWPWTFNPFDRLEVIDGGDISFDYGRPDTIPKQIEQSVAAILQKGVIPLSIGGDHFITYPILKAIHATHGPASLIHFDAHSDTWSDEIARVDHGTMFFHAANEGLINPSKSVQLGMRTCNPNDMGFQVFDALWMHKQGIAATLDKVRDIVGQRPCYITFDIDFLDPSCAPGTGTPVCGGFNTLSAIELLTGLAGMNIVGADLVEVAPAYDHAEITALAGATLANHMIALIAASPKFDPSI